MTKREGVKRLSIALGILTAIFVFFAILAAFDPKPDYLPRIVIASLVCGVAMWGIGHLVAWVIEGFKRDRSTRP